MHKTVVMFDFDGVLADTMAILLRNAQHAAARMNIVSKPTETMVRTLVRMEFEELALKMGIPELRIPDFLRHVLELSAQSKAPIFPGIAELLDNLAEARVCINTGNSHEAVRGFLDCHGLSGRVDSIMDKMFATTKEEKIQLALEKYHIRAGNAFMVGDAVSDIEAAKKTGVVSIAVSWGNQDLEMLKQAAPDYLVDRPAEILAIVKSRAASRRSGVSDENGA